MFGFLDMANNYDQRKVDCFEKGDLVVGTVAVSDGKQPYETGVQHPAYNDGKWVIVEGYDTKEDAQAGHDRWVEKMTSNNLPHTLEDCANAEIGQLARDAGCDMSFEVGQP